MVTFLVVIAVLIFIARNFLSILKAGFFLMLALIFMFILCIGTSWFGLDAGFFIKPLMIILFIIFLGSALLRNVRDSILSVIANVFRF